MENISMFDLTESKPKKEDEISVIEAEFVSEEKTNWRKLFKGFESLYVSTYSSSLNFIEQIIEEFSYVEIIF